MVQLSFDSYQLSIGAIDELGTTDFAMTERRVAAWRETTDFSRVEFQFQPSFVMA